MRGFTNGSTSGWRPILLLAVVFALCATRGAGAQTVCPNPCALSVGQSYSVTADHDGANTTGYRLYVDSVKQGGDLLLTALQSGSVTVSALVASSRGTHTFQFSAFNEDAESKGDPLSFTIKKPPPNKPTNHRIILAVSVAANGEISVKVVGIEAVK